MFPIIDAAAGMAFVYLLLSLVSSALREAAESVAGKRSAALKQGIERLLGPELAGKLYRHGLVAGLTDDRGGPSYISPRAFSSALQDLARAGEPLPDRVVEALRAVELQAAGDAARFQAGIEGWFNSAMDAVSGEYQRHTRLWLALIGMVVTIAMNADSIRMAGVLFGNSALAANVAETAGQFVPASGNFERGGVASGVEAAGRLSALGLPIGWDGATTDNALPWKETWKDTWKETWKTPSTGRRSVGWWSNAWLLFEWHWAGWLITAAAITVGAPFWFDLLDQIVRFRKPGGAEEPRSSV